MKYLKRFPISIQLSLLVAMIVVIVFIILLTNYSKSAQVVEEKNREYLLEMVAQLNQTISSNSDVLKRIVEKISYNPTIVQAYLSEKDPTVKYELYTKLSDYMSDMMSMKDGILDIALFGANGTKFNLNGDINNLVPFINEIPEKQLFYYSGIQKIPVGIFDRSVFIVGCPIYSITDFENTNEIGTLMVVVDANTLLGSPKNIAGIKEAQLYALDRKGNVFFSNDAGVKSGTPYSQIVSSSEKTKYFVQKGSIPDLNGELVFKLPQRELLRGIEAIRRQSFLILVISLLLISIPFSMIVNNILRPLKKLMKFMNDFKLGRLNNLSNRISLQGYAEISSMANNFNRMLDEIDELTRSLLESNTKLYKAELVKKQAELAFLQSQINPHFLYNTLESIKGMAVEHGSDRIFQTVKSLAYVFRYSIKAADIIALQEEVILVKSHIYIQQIRFGNRFTVSYQFPDAIMACKVPKMILQPVVENAVFHGIEPTTGHRHLQLAGEISGDYLLLTVTDNGTGIAPEKLLELRKYLAVIQETTDGSAHSIGLVNVNNRIKIYYGEAYGLTINSKLGEGTGVVIRLPYKEAFHV